MGSPQILGEVGVGALVFVAYAFVFECLTNVPALIAGTVVVLKTRNLNPEEKAGSFAKMISFSQWARIALGLLIAWGILAYGVQDARWFQIWNDPILLAIAAGVAILAGFFGSGSHFPHVRGSILELSATVWGAAGLVWVGTVEPSWIGSGPYRFGVLGAILSLVVITTLFFAGQGTPRRLARAQEISERLKSLNHELDSLNHVVNLYTDREPLNSFIAAKEDAEQALGLLRRGKLDRAEQLLGTAEITAKSLRNLLTVRVRSTIRVDLEGRLSLAKDDLDELADRVAAEHVGTDFLKPLTGEYDVLMAQVGRLVVNPDSLETDVAPFETFFRSVLDAKHAVRFLHDWRVDTGAWTGEIAESQKLLAVVDQLQIESAALRSSIGALKSRIDQLEQDPKSFLSDPIRAYRLLENVHGELVVQTGAVKSEIEASCETRVLWSGSLIIFVPKSCTTTGPARGAVILESEPRTGADVRLSFSAVRLEVSPPIDLSAAQGSKYAVAGFSFAGRKPKEGDLIISIQRNGGAQEQTEFRGITISSRGLEALELSLPYAAIGGAPAAFLFYALGLSFESISLLSGGVGLLAVVLVFALRSLGRTPIPSTETARG